MAKQLIQFHRVAALPATGVVGAIYFNTTDNTINICTGAGQFEAYAGKLQNAEWNAAKSKLTIKKYDGSSIELDFSDMASASDLTTKLGEINTAISGVDAKAIQNAKDIENLGQTVATNKTAADTGIQEAKTAASNVANDLSAHKSAYDAKVAALEATDANYKTRIETLEGLLGDGDGSVADQINDAIAANNAGHVATELGKKVDKTTYDAYVEANYEAVAAVKKTAEDEVTNRTNAIAGIEAKIGGAYTSENTVAKDIQAAKDAAAAAQADIDAFFVLKDGETLNEAFDTLKEIQDYITEDGKAADALTKRVGANETAIGALQGKVDVDKVSTAIATAKSEITGTLAEDDFKTLETINDELDRLAGLAGTDSVAAQIAAVTDPMKQNITDLQTGLQGVPGQISSAVGTAKTELVGGASADYNTLKKLEDKVKAAQAAADGGVQSVAGDTYVKATTTAGAVVLETQVGSVSVDADKNITTTDGLATVKMVKDYVDNTFMWAEF